MPAQIDRAMIAARGWKVPGRIMAWAFIEGRPLTTRGRWINPAVFAGYRLAQLLSPPRRAGAPIYVIGSGRSGTTVLGNLLGIHRDLIFLNEPKALWHFAHGAEDLIGNYTAGPARVRLDAGEATPAMARQIARVYDWAALWGRARRVVDKYPELAFRTGFVRALFPSARFIAILRDGVDTVVSIANWSAHHGSGSNDWWGRDGRKWQLLRDQIIAGHKDLAGFANAHDQRDRAALEWIVTMREIDAIRALAPDAILPIGYEALCAEPEGEMARILHYCALAPDPVLTRLACATLKPASARATLALDPALVPVFRAALLRAGYGQSRERVTARSG